MKELMVAARKTAEDDPECDYYILVDEVEVAGGFACESYGVKIRSRRSGESAQLLNITTSVSRIDELLELLMRNTVTPVTLRDVVEDWL